MLRDMYTQSKIHMLAYNFSSFFSRQKTVSAPTSASATPAPRGLALKATRQRNEKTAQRSQLYHPLGETRARLAKLQQVRQTTQGSPCRSTLRRGDSGTLCSRVRKGWLNLRRRNRLTDSKNESVLLFLLSALNVSLLHHLWRKPAALNLNEVFGETSHSSHPVSAAFPKTVRSHLLRSEVITDALFFFGGGSFIEFVVTLAVKASLCRKLCALPSRNGLVTANAQA